MGIEFVLNDKQVQWLGESFPDVQPVQLQCLRRIFTTDAIDTYYHLELIGVSLPKSPDPPPTLSTLLESFEDSFTKPHSLPPAKPFSSPMLLVCKKDGSRRFVLIIGP